MREEHPLHSVHVPDAFSNQALQFPAYAATVFLLRGRHMHHGADPGLAALPCHESADECFTIDPVCLGPAVPSRDGNRGWVNHMALDLRRKQCAMDPEPIQPGYLDHDHRHNFSGPPSDGMLQVRKALQEFGNIATPDLMTRHPRAQGGCKRRDQLS